MNRSRHVLAAVTLVWAILPAAGQAPPLRIDRGGIGISKAIPKVGDEVVLLVPVTNPTDEPQSGAYVLRATAGHETGREAELARRDLRLQLQPDESRDVELAWQPSDTGFYRVRLELCRAGETGSGRVRRTEFGPVAVTARGLYFAWFGTPTEFRWCNVPTTVKDEDIEYWLRRGAIPCQWRGGVCYKDWTKEQLIESWGSSKWIAIDEIGGPGEPTTKFMEALREIKSTRPEHFVAVWFMGAHDYWAEVKDIIDLFLPEVYLNYRGNHLGQFDSYLDTIRRTATVSQTLFGLGINIVRDKETKEPKVVPTQEDVLRQIRHIKRIAPDMPGIAFFTSYSAAPGVAEYADELCGEYFVKPLLTIPDQRVDIGNGVRPLARVKVANHGGMTARGVKVRLCQVGPGGEVHAESEARIKQLPVGETSESALALSPAPGVSTVRAEIAPSQQYTILDGAAAEFACTPEFLPDGVSQALAVAYLPSWDGGDREDVPMSYRLDGPARPLHVVELAATGEPKADAAAPVSAEDEAVTVRWVASGTTRAGETRFYALLPGEAGAAAAGPALQCERTGDTLRIGGPHYTGQLDLATDQIVSLKPAGSDTELLKAPWALRGVRRDGMGAAEVRQSDGWVEVTVPFESDAAEGDSRYLFAAGSPAIEVSRCLRPKSPLSTEGVSDRCGLEQRGGSYACQPGVGGPVRRGVLEDRKEYRDILFGYLGGRPTEDNARKAGWIDFSWGERWNAGLGVAIAERWRDARFRSYDVTRLYDASDWLEITYVWGTDTVIEREQRCRHFLLPHLGADMTDDSTVPPAQGVWETVQQPARAVALLGAK